MLWRGFATLLGTIRTRFMATVELDPKFARQGAAAVLCVAATAAAMPLIAGRGAEQREDAFWAARAAQFHQSLQASAEAEPAALVQLASFNAAGVTGLSARGSGFLNADALDRNALTIASRVTEAFGLATLDPIEPGAAGRIVRSLREQHCLAQAVYYEARGESYEGQLAVAEVVRNRVKSRLWPNTYCGVVFQGSERSTGCQFTFTCDGQIKAKARGPAWRQAQTIASQVYGGLTKPITGGATHYHTNEVDPSWNNTLMETRRIGAHIFFRHPTRSERAAAQVEARLRGRYDAAPAAAPAPMATATADVAT